MEFLDKRTTSFKAKRGKKAWPIKSNSKYASPSFLALVGFYHTPSKQTSSILTCFFCSKICDWEEECSNPIIYHLRNEPCEFIRMWGGIEGDHEWSNMVQQDQGQVSQEIMLQLLKSTFSGPVKWPFGPKEAQKRPTADEMAKAGFCFVPMSDSNDHALCPSCEVSLDGWDESDNVLYEHTKPAKNTRKEILIAYFEEKLEFQPEDTTKRRPGRKKKAAAEPLVESPIKNEEKENKTNVRKRKVIETDKKDQIENKTKETSKESTIESNALSKEGVKYYLSQESDTVPKRKRGRPKRDEVIKDQTIKSDNEPVSLKADVGDAKNPLEANKTITNSAEQSSKRTKKSNKPIPVLVDAELAKNDKENENTESLQDKVQERKISIVVPLIEILDTKPAKRAAPKKTAVTKRPTQRKRGITKSPIALSEVPVVVESKIPNDIISPNLGLGIEFGQAMNENSTSAVNTLLNENNLNSNVISNKLIANSLNSDSVQQQIESQNETTDMIGPTKEVESAAVNTMPTSSSAASNDSNQEPECIFDSIEMKSRLSSSELESIYQSNKSMLLKDYLELVGSISAKKLESAMQSELDSLMNK